MLRIDLRKIFNGLTPIDFVFDPAFAHVDGNVYLLGMTVFRRYFESSINEPMAPDMTEAEKILYNPYHPFAGGRCRDSACVYNSVAADAGGFVKNFVVLAQFIGDQLVGINSSAHEIAAGDNMRIVKFSSTNFAILFDKWEKDASGDWKQLLVSHELTVQNSNQIVLAPNTTLLSNENSIAAIWIRQDSVYFCSFDAAVFKFGTKLLSSQAEMKITKAVFDFAGYLPGTLKVFAPPIEFGTNSMVGVGQITINLAANASNQQLSNFVSRELLPRRLDNQISLGFCYIFNKQDGAISKWSKFFTFDGMTSLVPCAITKVVDFKYAIAVSNLKEVAQIYFFDIIHLLIDLNPQEIDYINL